MGLIGSGYKDDEPIDEERERYREITGSEFHGNMKEFRKEIDRVRDDGWTSRKERKDLGNLKRDLDD
jgi:hypothetical protein